MNDKEKIKQLESEIEILLIKIKRLEQRIKDLTLAIQLMAKSG
tara:strand:- start:6629 stop:6757 length:129 start_codon:yes stop_codon:yes gene_type:complete